MCGCWNELGQAELNEHSSISALSDSDGVEIIERLTHV